MATENAANKRIAVIAGASGQLGSECLRLLLESDDYRQVFAVVRRPLEPEHLKVTQIPVNFRDLPQLSCFSSADVFCVIGTTMKIASSRSAFRDVDFDATLAFAKAAAGGGARQFVLVTSIGADPHSKTFYLRVKGEVEEALQPLPFKSLHIFRPGFLVGDRADSRIGEQNSPAMAKTQDFTLAGKMKIYSSIHVTQLATAMLAVAVSSSPGKHTYEYERIIELANK